MRPREFASRIDHTVVAKAHTRDEVEDAREDAAAAGTNLCVPPNRVAGCAGAVDGELMTVVGFPMGYVDAEVKAHETGLALERGADSVDVACDVSLLLSEDERGFRGDVEAVVEAAGSCGTVKAIVETGLLSSAQVERAARICDEADVDLVKTSTGFFGEGASREAVELLDGLGLDCGVKASGGVRTVEEALDLLDAGADRVGSSRGAEIAGAYARRFG